MRNDKINGKDVGDFIQSYSLRYLFESTLSDFYKLSDEEKKKLCIKFDEEFSERFLMPRANFIFEEKEYDLDICDIYFGNINKINSGFEFMFRYFFGKRQQFQKLCVRNNDAYSFGSDFALIKEGYTEMPISKSSKYIPYSKGLKNYLFNFIKLDAMVFAFDQCDTVIDCCDVSRVASNMSFIDVLKLSRSIRSVDKMKKKIEREVLNISMNPEYSRIGYKIYLSCGNEEKFLNYLYDVIEGKKIDGDYRIVFLFFHKNIWDSLDLEKKKLVVSIANERIAEMFGCEKIKEVEYSLGDNSYQFGDEDKVYVGDIRIETGESVLQKLVYEYSFNKNYENIFKLDEETGVTVLDEVEKCKRIFKQNRDYSQIKEYQFIKCVRKTAVDFLDNAYRYISNNLRINGKKVAMEPSKDQFIVDIFKKSKRRG